MASTVKTTAIIVGAGSSSRMKGMDKCLVNLLGHAVISYTIKAFEDNDLVDDIVIVTKKQSIKIIEKIVIEHSFKKVYAIVEGGDTRQKSVEAGILATPKDADYLCVHDGGRPLVSDSVITDSISSCYKHKAVTVAVPVKDTIKVVKDDYVVGTPRRSSLFSVQTPQVFQKELLCEGLKNQIQQYTDDCQLVEAMGVLVYIVKGEYSNIKITTPEDLIFAEAILLKRGKNMRIGHGYDVHRLVENRKLILCGVELDYVKGLLGHSDADVALHSIMDALLGACALGDIGKIFPDSDSSYAGADSGVLLKEVMKLISSEGYAIENIDCTIVAQLPKISPYTEKMRANVAKICAIDISQISVKATTEERLGFTGEGLAIAAHCVCLVRNIINR